MEEFNRVKRADKGVEVISYTGRPSHIKRASVGVKARVQSAISKKFH